jgi:Dolichyl-phosphate-mannose-protein mannosyltransferase
VTVVADVRADPRATMSPAVSWEKLWWMPLVVILAMQAVLSARLMPGAYVSGDEGRYIYAGHQLIYEFWHSGGSPYYETYFSGAPVMYPVLAAMADHVGGLVAVRLMSLCFMLTATAFLFATTRRLFGYLSGLLAAGLFAGLGLTQDLGALATYDAMALMLMSIAAYCAVRSSERRWLLMIPIAILAANATKYVTLLFDPVIVMLAALQLRPACWRWVARRTLALGLTGITLLSIALFLAGSAYFHGLMYSSLSRKGGEAAAFAAAWAPDHVIIMASLQWVGVVLAGSFLALIVAAVRRDANAALMVGLLLLAGAVITLEGLHLHTIESMRKHDDFAAWFACVATGYLVATRQVRHSIAAAAVAIVALVITISSIHYSALARSTYEAGGSDRTLLFAAAVEPYIIAQNRHYLIGGFGDDQVLYMVHSPARWFQQFDDLYIKAPIAGRGGDWHGQARGLACMVLRPNCMYLEGIAGYRLAIREHWFSLVSLWGDHGTLQDKAIAQAVEHTRGYVLVTNVGGAPTWIYAPAYQTRLHLTAFAARLPRPAGTHYSRRVPVSAQSVVRPIVLTFVPSAVFALASVVLVLLVNWTRRRRRRPGYAPLWALAYVVLIVVVATVCGVVVYTFLGTGRHRKARMIRTARLSASAHPPPARQRDIRIPWDLAQSPPATAVHQLSMTVPLQATRPVEHMPATPGGRRHYT